VFRTQDDAALDRERPTFIEQLLRGEALLEDIEDFVETWHDAPDDSSIAAQSLEEFLGMTWDEYRLWVERPEALRFIAAAHRQGKPIATILSSVDRYGLAARAGDQREAHELLQWLIERGRAQEIPL
jgi:hypothetical protein